MIDVLIVDDEITFLKSLSEGLCHCSPQLNVVTTDKVDTALELLSTREIDVAVTDLVMDGKDGFEFMRAAGRLHPELPVIIMSACSRISIEEKLQGLKFAGYLEKPVVLEEVASAIEDAAKDLPAKPGGCIHAEEQTKRAFKQK